MVKDIAIRRIQMNIKKIITIFSIIGVILLLSQQSKLMIYTTDTANKKILVHSTISIMKVLPMDKKLNHLASKLSHNLFQDKSIVFLGIKTEDGKEVAYFDLEDKNKDSTKSWYPFFQGSSGADSTLNSIKETLLQREYKGDWIDGIRITYNGSYTELDHITFEDRVFWRNN